MNRVIKNFENLPQDDRIAFVDRYKEGIEDSIMRITKPDNSQLFVVPFQTDSTYYLVKISSLQNAEEEHILDDEFLEGYDPDYLNLAEPDEDLIE